MIKKLYSISLFPDKFYLFEKDLDKKQQPIVTFSETYSEKYYEFFNKWCDHVNDSQKNNQYDTIYPTHIGNRNYHNHLNEQSCTTHVDMNFNTMNN